MSEAQSATVKWAGIDIEVRFTKNWLCGAAHHIELRANEPLSVTATGYKSHFVPSDINLDLDLVIDFVIGWLDDAAENRSWQDHIERRQQGDLFDRRYGPRISGGLYDTRRCETITTGISARGFEAFLCHSRRILIDFEIGMPTVSTIPTGSLAFNFLETSAYNKCKN